jgi:hypothetical protein
VDVQNFCTQLYQGLCWRLQRLDALLFPLQQQHQQRLRLSWYL